MSLLQGKSNYLALLDIYNCC